MNFCSLCLDCCWCPVLSRLHCCSAALRTRVDDGELPTVTSVRCDLCPVACSPRHSHSGSISHAVSWRSQSRWSLQASGSMLCTSRCSAAFHVPPELSSVMPSVTVRAVSGVVEIVMSSTYTKYLNPHAPMFSCFCIGRESGKWSDSRKGESHPYNVKLLRFLHHVHVQPVVC